MKDYNVVVVGAGMVGKQMVEILLERNFPFRSLRILATRSRMESIAGRDFSVEETTLESFKGVDIAFFAGTEGEKGASILFAKKAAEMGVVVIDNGGDFRMEPDIPLVVPEVNPSHLDSHHGIIANPNCSTIQLVVALSPLHRAFRLTEAIVTTFQAVSGTGREAVEELDNQIRGYVAGQEVPPQVYPYPIAGNVIPRIGTLSSTFPGYFTEEVKMVMESRKILDHPTLHISSTCVRVPVFNGHSEAVTARFADPFEEKEVRALLSVAPGISLIDDPEHDGYPVPLSLSQSNEVFVGRIRRNIAFPDALDMWVVADNIRKGAALNAVQIAETMIERSLL